MKTEMIMPQMGESITEASILKWHKQAGDKVQKDETILEISTDKVDSEIPATASGILVEILFPEGAVVPVKSVIAVIDDAATGAVKGDNPTKDASKKDQGAERKEVSSGPVVTSTVKPSGLSNIPHSEQPTRTTGVESSTHRFYSPLVRNIAQLHGLTDSQLGSIAGSGNQGRVTKSDVLSYLDTKDSSTDQSSQNLSSVSPQNSSSFSVPSTIPSGLDVRIEPMDNMRKKIAEHMMRSKATSPHVYTVAECDVTNVAKWREKIQKSFVAKEGFKISFTPFFLEAVARALKAFPYVNASVEGTNMLLKRDVNLGCAVALGNTGLIVPVIKNADQLNLTGLARALNDIAGRARDKKLKPDETQGGTFTVTNPGIFGSIMGFPIISQPQVAILGIGAIKKRPMVVGEMIGIRDMVYLTLSYDHRIVDGSMAGQFLQQIVKHLEEWDIKRDL